MPYVVPDFFLICKLTNFQILNEQWVFFVCRPVFGMDNALNK